MEKSDLIKISLKKTQWDKTSGEEKEYYTRQITTKT